MTEKEIEDVFNTFFKMDVSVIFKGDPERENMALLRKDWIFRRFKAKKSHGADALFEAIEDYKRDDEENSRMIESRPDLY